MTTAFADALDLLFRDPNIAREALYIAAGGAPTLVRVVTRRADGKRQPITHGAAA